MTQLAVKTANPQTNIIANEGIKNDDTENKFSPDVQEKFCWMQADSYGLIWSVGSGKKQVRQGLMDYDGLIRIHEWYRERDLNSHTIAGSGF